MSRQRSPLSPMIYFLSCRLNIKAVKKSVARYEKVAGANDNINVCLQLGACRGGVPLSGPFRWSDDPV